MKIYAVYFLLGIGPLSKCPSLTELGFGGKTQWCWKGSIRDKEPLTLKVCLSDCLGSQVISGVCVYNISADKQQLA